MPLLHRSQNVLLNFNFQTFRKKNTQNGGLVNITVNINRTRFYIKVVIAFFNYCATRLVWRQIFCYYLLNNICLFIFSLKFIISLAKWIHGDIIVISSTFNLIIYLIRCYNLDRSIYSSLNTGTSSMSCMCFKFELLCLLMNLSLLINDWLWTCNSCLMLFVGALSLNFDFLVKIFHFAWS